MINFYATDDKGLLYESNHQTTNLKVSIYTLVRQKRQAEDYKKIPLLDNIKNWQKIE